MRAWLVIATLLLPGPAAAQSVLWAGYGHNADHASGLATGEHINMGWAHARPAGGLALGLGLPVDGEASSRWGSLGGWLEARRSHGAGTVLGVRGTAAAFAFADPILDSRGAGTVAAADGHGELGLADVRLRLRAGGRHGTHAVDGAVSQRLLGRVGAGAGTALGPVDVRADLDHWRAEEGGYTQVGGRLSLMQPRFQAWAALEHWLDEQLGATGWEAGVRVPVTNRLAFMVRGGHQAADILFWVPAQRSWSLALQLRTGADPLTRALPAPVVRDARRAVTLTLPANGLEAPAVAGTFSDWEKLPMHRVGGEWRLDLTLPPGVHEYAFVDADGTWFVPEGTPGRKPDGFGGHVAVVIVR